MKFLNRCWCLLLGALLPAACSDNGVDPVEYGAPHATLNLDGVVADNLGTPVKDIVLEVEGFGSTTSDEQGVWSLQSVGFSSCLTDSMIVCGLTATDVDGTDNGGPYPPTLVELDVEKTEDGSGWNIGTFEQHDIRVIMEDVVVEYGPLCVRAALANLLNAEKQSKERKAR
jgi:putative lipoprotein (rSAM/lipoprotein system)